MSIKINVPDVTELKPRITVIGVGGAGGNAINNMVTSGVSGVEFVAANTDSQALSMSSAEHRIQMGVNLTEGLGAGSHPEIGEAAAQEAIEEIKGQISGSHMVFVAAGMGGGTGTGAAPVIAQAAKSQDILTVAVVTKPFQFEGQRRMKAAEKGIEELRKNVDTLIVIPNQNLFRIANEKTTFSDAFKLADQVLHAGIACITDLIMKDGLINLDFADVRAVMSGMGSAMMGTGEATGERRALRAAEEAICNPLLDDVSMRGAKALLISITGSTNDLTLYEVDEAASRIREDVASDANIILGATYDDTLSGHIRVSIVASGIGPASSQTMDFQPDRLETSDPVDTFEREEPEPEPQSKRKTSRFSSPFMRPEDDEIREEHHQREQADFEEEEVLDLSAEEKVWQGPGDVTIEKRPPHLLPSPNQMIPGHKSDADQPQDGDSFAPSAPSRVRRRPRQMPDLEDFPEVGQKELRARTRVTHDDDEVRPKKKRSIFERLASVGGFNRGSDSYENSDSDPHDYDEREDERAFTHRQSNQSSSYVNANDRDSYYDDEYTEKRSSTRKYSRKKLDDDDDDIEIPAFLHREIK